MDPPIASSANATGKEKRSSRPRGRGRRGPRTNGDGVADAPLPADATDGKPASRRRPGGRGGRGRARRPKPTTNNPEDPAGPTVPEYATALPSAPASGLPSSDPPTAAARSCSATNSDDDTVASDWQADDDGGRATDSGSDEAENSVGDGSHPSGSLSPDAPASATAVSAGKGPLAGSTSAQGRGAGKASGQLPKENISKAEALIAGLRKGTLECLVCIRPLGKSFASWECGNCHAIFHLWCIRSWIHRHSGMRGDARLTAPPPAPCPLCRSAVLDAPPEARCWCRRKVLTGLIDTPSGHRSGMEDRGGSAAINIPLSCGQPCPRSTCRHPCPFFCHPGPCSPCVEVVDVSCFCGSTVKQLPCASATPESCNGPCGRAICRRHVCERICHDGDCAPCTRHLPSTCWCGSSQNCKIDCSLCTDEAEPSAADKEAALFFTGYRHSCGKICGKTLRCGAHTCEQVCHEGPCGVCPRTPDLSKTAEMCPCGKQPLHFVPGGRQRRHCTDPIPSCGNTCGRPLRCIGDHKCVAQCHDSPCPPCSARITVSCSCGKKRTQMPCIDHENRTDEFTCSKKCGTALSCGRHFCKKLCCVAQGDSSAEAHQCQLVCSKKLSCYLHNCEQLCHTGPCGACAHVITEDFPCACGRTVTKAPAPCGTLPRICTYPCTVKLECGHPQPRHSCHSGPCPSCKAIVSKKCAGGHDTLPNCVCGGPAPKCSKVCGSLLPCKVHTCERACHDGPCTDKTTCTKTCLLIRSCGHVCQSRCHAGVSCKASGIVCDTEIPITCPCGRRAGAISCNHFQKKAKQLMRKRQKDAGGSVETPEDNKTSGVVATAPEGDAEDEEEADDLEVTRPVAPDLSVQLVCDNDCQRFKDMDDAPIVSVVSQPLSLDLIGPTPWRDIDTIFWPRDIIELSAKFLPFLTKLESRLLKIAKDRATERVMLPPINSLEKRKVAQFMSNVFGLESRSLDKDFAGKTMLFVGRTRFTRVPKVLLSDLATAHSRGNPIVMNPPTDPYSAITFTGLDTTVTSRFFRQGLQPFMGNFLIEWHDDVSCTLTFTSVAAANSARQYMDLSPGEYFAYSYPCRRPEPTQPKPPKTKPRDDDWHVSTDIISELHQEAIVSVVDSPFAILQ